MSVTNFSNQQPYMRTSREFPTDLENLTLEVNRAYLDTANAVNSRTIGLVNTSKPSITGNAYYLSSTKKKESFRQAYTFTTAANIPHGIDTTKTTGFVTGYGSYTDGTNYYGIPFMTNTAIAGQLTFYVTPQNIIFSVGAGSPAVTSGTIILEWLSFG